MRAPRMSPARSTNPLLHFRQYRDAATRERVLVLLKHRLHFRREHLVDDARDVVLLTLDHRVDDDDVRHALRRRSALEELHAFKLLLARGIVALTKRFPVL